MSLIDVISEVYNKISKLLGPSPFHPSHHMMGPLGLLTPLPGASYLFHGDSSLPHPNNQQSNASVNSDQDVPGSLWSIANASLNASGIAGPPGSTMFGNALGSPPLSNWTPSLGDMVLKIDGKLKVRVASASTLDGSVNPCFTENHNSVTERPRRAGEEWDQGRVGVPRTFAKEQAPRRVPAGASDAVPV